MELNSHIGLFRIPDSFIYAGDDYLEIYRVNRQKAEKIDTLDGISILNLSSRNFRDVVENFTEGTNIGLVLNSSQFIFNILEFDKIPFRKNLRRDLIEWKIKKVFPEDINQYDHDFFVLSKKRILSVLFKKDMKHKIEKLIDDSNHSLIYLGNSTIELMNHILRGKRIPDFFMEIDKQLLVVVFQHRSVPYYIRKFRVEQTDEIKDEIFKTLRYVTGTFGSTPRTYALVSRDDNRYRDIIRQDLNSAELVEVPLDSDRFLFLPDYP